MTYSDEGKEPPQPEQDERNRHERRQSDATCGRSEPQTAARQDRGGRRDSSVGDEQAFETVAIERGEREDDRRATRRR